MIIIPLLLITWLQKKSEKLFCSWINEATFQTKMKFKIPQALQTYDLAKWVVYREEKGKLNLKQHAYWSTSTVTKLRAISTSDENIRFISALKDAVSSLDTAVHTNCMYLNSEAHIIKEPFPIYSQLQKSSSSLVTFLHDLVKFGLTDFYFDRHSLAVRASQKSSWLRVSLKRQLLPESCVIRRSCDSF